MIRAAQRRLPPHLHRRQSMSAKMMQIGIPFLEGAEDARTLLRDPEIFVGKPALARILAWPPKPVQLHVGFVIGNVDNAGLKIF